MKQIKVKSQRNLLTQQFKEKCKEVLKQEPRNYLLSAIRDHHLTLDISLFTPEDIPFFHLILTLPIHKLTVMTPDPNNEKSPSKNKNKDPQALQIKTFPETPKFRQFMGFIGQAMQSNTSLRTVKIERVPISVRSLKELNEGLVKTTSLREFELIGCCLTDQHLETIKVALAKNQSLMTLNFSKNNLCNVGGMIGHILCEHSQRRNEIVFFLNIRGETPAEDLSNSGLCEVNLEGNHFNDKAAIELASFLKSDSWTKCLNLRHNQIRSEGVRQLALMLKVNSSLISLDMRGNEGLSKEFSRYIYKKLVLNMQKYKQQKQFYQKCKQPSVIPQSEERTPAKEIEQNSELASKYKTVKDRYLSGRYDSKEYTTIAEPTIQNQKNNMTLDRKIRKVPKETKTIQIQCPNCKHKTFQMLRLQKKNLDLQLQLRKVKHTLLTKNVDISAIQPNSNNQNSAIEWLSNRSNNQNDDQLLQRMEQIMLQLTRVIETMEEHQNTKVHTTNPLDNPNSFSNTIQLYEKNSHLQDLSKEIQEDRLRSVLEDGGSLEAGIDENSNP